MRLPKALFALSFLLGSLPGFLFAAKDDARPVEDANKQELQQVANPKLPTLWLVGDSTVKVGTPKQRGWGDEIAAFFDTEKINVVNRAIGGRSSRTFQTEGRWEKVLSELKAGDFVLVQFGHNDSGPLNDTSRARGTIKGNGEETEEIDNLLTKKHELVHSYGWYMRKYVTDAQAKGATVVVCSLIPRKTWTPEGKVARASESYGKWAREAATQTGALFVDLNEIIAGHYETLGKEAVEKFFADAHTHTTVEGAKFNAGCVVEGLKALPKNPLAPYLR